MKLREVVRKRIYAVAGSLALVGILAMRWNVVIGGQLFSKSFLGYTTYKMALATREGLLVSIALLLLPLPILAAAGEDSASLAGARARCDSRSCGAINGHACASLHKGGEGDE